MPRKIILITGIGHSGTTLLSLILGSQPSMTAMGETFQIFVPRKDGRLKAGKATCSCGEQLRECTFWSPVIQSLRENLNLSHHERHALILKSFDDAYGPEQVMVDSSKRYKALQYLSTHEADVRVIHLIKDVRAYTVSAIDTAIRHAKRRRDGGVTSDSRNIIKRIHQFVNLSAASYDKRSALFYFRRWYAHNKRIQTFLAGQNKPHMTIGYEELCMRPKVILPKLSAFLDEPINHAELDLTLGDGHLAFSNRMKRQADKLQQISYDHRWFVRKEWTKSAMLMPGIMRYNREKVYSNATDDLWRT